MKYLKMPTIRYEYLYTKWLAFVYNYSIPPILFGSVFCLKNPQIQQQHTV